MFNKLSFFSSTTTPGSTSSLSSGDARTAATLIEPGVRSFLKLSLQNCRQFKAQYYNTIFNTCTLFLFVAVIGTILFIKYKTKPTADEVERRKQQQREYVLSQLKLVNAKNYLAAKNATYYAVGSGSGPGPGVGPEPSSSSSQMITGLPEWNVGAATAGHYKLFVEDQQEKRNDEEYYLRMKTSM
jgi:hypothetical protein